MIDTNKKYKMYIPKEVGDTIKTLCREIPNLEWSGILFYTYENNILGELKINVVDIYPMDIGTVTTTEFEITPEVASYIAENINLFECQIGLVHSHNNMKSFFSGTDINTLKEEGEKRNHFLSLVVNNSGEYVAKITSKKINKKIVNIKYIIPSFDNSSFEGTAEEEIEDIEVLINDIEIESDSYNNNSSLLDRIKELKSRPKSLIYKPFTSTYKPINRYYEEDYDDYDYTPYSKKKEINIKTNTEIKKSNNNIDNYYDIDFNNVDIPNKDIKDLTNQILTGSILAGNSKFDLDKWVCESMNKILDNRFSSVEEYKLFMDNFVELVLYDYKNEELDVLFDDIQILSIIAFKIKENISNIKKGNKYLDIINNILETFIKIV